MAKTVKYKVTNLTIGRYRFFTQQEFAKQHPETFRLMEESCLSMIKRDLDPDTTGQLVERLERDLPICQSCGAVAIVEVNAKCNDMCEMTHLHRSYDGHVLRDMGVGEEDYIEFEFCTNCGQIQGKFPKRIHGALVTKETEGYPYGD